MNKFKVLNSIICDVARREVSGKDILVGVYANGINFENLPASINLAFWLELLAEQPGNLTVFIRIEPPGASNPVDIGFNAVVINEKESIPLFTPSLLYSIVAPGEIKLSVRPSKDATWKVVKRVKIQQAPRPAHLSQPPAAPPPA